MAGESREQSALVDLGADPRKVFRHQLKPVLETIKGVSRTERVLGEYKNSLNAVLSDPNLGEIEEAARFVLDFGGEARAPAGRIAAFKEAHPDEDPKSQVGESARKVFEWFAHRRGNAVALLSESIPQDEGLQEDLRQLIGRNLSSWIGVAKGYAGPFVKADLHERELADAEDFLIGNSPGLAGLKRRAAIEVPLSSVLVDEQVDAATLRLDQGVLAFESRDFTSRNAKGARAGRRIYDTPFYEDALEDLHFRERKENGIGGVILYGPPGTGKTELLQEKNRREGYKTRVVSMHHYTSFAELIGDRAVQVGVDQSAPLSEKLKRGLDTFEEGTPEEFGQVIGEMFNTLKSEGKVPADETMGSFLKTFIAQDTDVDLDAAGFSPDDWGKIRSKFLVSQRVRMMRTLMPGHLQETDEDIVKGEILLAIQNGERVVLDEVDKAGAGSLGGLLKLLAQHPGSTLEFGNSSVQIPKWFRVDATSNKADLDEYLKDRFSGMNVGIPPIKDQLMIAAVRLSDTEGNILLTSAEQGQLAAYFMYIVPEVNKVMAGNQLPPLSNRSIQEITSYLVDFGNMERTNVSVGRAVRMLLTKNKMWVANQKVAGEINGVLERFEPMIYEEPFNIVDGDTKRYRRGTVRNIAYGEMKKIRDEAVRKIVAHPLSKVINGLGVEIDPESGSTIRRIELTAEQQRRIREFLGRKKPKNAADTLNLPIGFVLHTDYAGQKPLIELVSLPEDADSKTLIVDNLPHSGRILAATADGKKVVLASPGTEGRENLEIVNLFGRNPDAVSATDEPISVSQGVRAELDPSGRNLAIMDGSTLFLNSLNRKVDNVVRFAFSGDGKVLLIEKVDGTTSLYDSKSLVSHGNLSLVGTGWKFADNLLVQESADRSIRQQAFYIS